MIPNYWPQNLNTAIGIHPDYNTIRIVFLSVLELMDSNNWEGACHESCAAIHVLLSEFGVQNNWCIGEIRSGVFVINKISYIKNAIEDHPRNDQNNKSNAYLRDSTQYNNSINEILNEGYLPVSFHTHPTDSSDLIRSMKSQHFQMETSQQDRLISNKPITLKGAKMIMPECLIVGNSLAGNEIFIGFYNGLVSPDNFEDSKKKVQLENYKRVASEVSSLKLSDLQKIGLALGALLLLFVIFKYRKQSFSIALGLASVIPLMMNGTKNIDDDPDYFNKLSSGVANIKIPNQK
jgi:hypothetical protein